MDINSLLSAKQSSRPVSLDGFNVWLCLPAALKAISLKNITAKNVPLWGRVFEVYEVGTHVCTYWVCGHNFASET